MMDFLISLDKQWMLLINSANSPYWDAFFYIFTQTKTWIPFYVLLAMAFFRHQGGKGLITIIFAALVITICDQIASGIFKEMVERYRPSHDPILKHMVHLVGGKKGALYGFFSSHAANSFGLAVFTALIFKNRFYTATIILWALINSYSRIYLGLHYPGDILAGMICGIVVAALMYRLYLAVIPRFIVIPHHNLRTLKKSLHESFGRQTPVFLAITMLVIISTFLLVAKVVLKLF
jgi:undecaprenyl-diphosphatase